VFFDEPEPSVAQPRRELPEPPPVQNPAPDSPPSPEAPAPAAASDAPM
jgi:hypothetical protein